jgi:hypothetical protein
VTAEQMALEYLHAWQADPDARAEVLYALAEFFDAAYTIVGQNVPRKLWLERIDRARAALQRRLNELCEGSAGRP